MIGYSTTQKFNLFYLNLIKAIFTIYTIINQFTPIYTIKNPIYTTTTNSHQYTPTLYYATLHAPSLYLPSDKPTISDSLSPTSPSRLPRCELYPSQQKAENVICCRGRTQHHYNVITSQQTTPGEVDCEEATVNVETEEVAYFRSKERLD